MWKELAVSFLFLFLIGSVRAFGQSPMTPAPIPRMTLAEEALRGALNGMLMAAQAEQQRYDAMAAQVEALEARLSDVSAKCGIKCAPLPSPIVGHR